MFDKFTFPTNAEVNLSDPRVRKAIYETYGRIDFWSRAPLSFEAMQLDHVLPRAHGGPDNIYNLVPTTSKINSEKNAKIDEVAVTAVLGIIRTVYGAKVIAALGSLSKKYDKKVRAEAPKKLTALKEPDSQGKRPQSALRELFSSSSDTNAIYCMMRTQPNAQAIKFMEMLRESFKCSSFDISSENEVIEMTFEEGHPHIELYKKAVLDDFRINLTMSKFYFKEKAFVESITNAIQFIKCKSYASGRTKTLSFAVASAIVNFLNQANDEKVSDFYKSGQMTTKLSL